MNPTTVRRASLSAGMTLLGGREPGSLLASCQKKAAAGAPPAPEVTVLTVRRQTIPGQYEWVAQAAASKSVQMAPRTLSPYTFLVPPAHPPKELAVCR